MAAPEEQGGPTAEDLKRLEGTNLENYGSKEHRDLRKAAAQGERAWDGIEGNDEEAIRVWRIEKFNVVDWPEDEYGEFFNGDSYIILNAYKNPDEDAMKYDVHFWLGSETTQDEAGTAAYKTVELDDLLGDLPVQYREVEGHESKKFKDLFEEITIMQGGVETGFRHVEAEVYPHRLFHIHQNVARKGRGKKKKTQADEVPKQIDSLCSTDSFVLDTGSHAIVFNPPLCSPWEKRAASEFVNKLVAKRNGRMDKVFITWDDQTEDADMFWEHFGGKPDELPETSVHQQRAQEEEANFGEHENCIYHITDEHGALTCEQVDRGVLDISILEREHDDVLLVDVGRVIYVWIGSTANKVEKTEAMRHAMQFLEQSGRPLHTPIRRICQGQENDEFRACFGCEHVAVDVV